MEFRDLKRQYSRHKAEIDSAIQSVINNTNFISGAPIKELEQILADYVGVKYCITCANGTDALHLALMAWGIGSGDAVFVPDFTFFSSGEVVSAVGATPIFVDVNPDTYNMDAESLRNAIEYVTNNTDLQPHVIIAVDLFGQPADYSRIRKIAKEYDMWLLEDGAQGFGGRIGDRLACSFGDISTTSFFPAKPLGCYGDGGAIFTDNEEWAQVLHSLCVHGKGKDKYDNVRIGMNSRLDTIQAAVLLEKMKFFDEEVAACNLHADYYSEALNGVVKTPKVCTNMLSSWAQYTIQVGSAEQRKILMDTLKEQGIPTAIYYNKPMHQQVAFQDTYGKDLDYRNTLEISQKCLSLPMHPYLREDELQRITKIIQTTV